MRHYGVTILRYTIGIVFVWFGALKAFHMSPVADLVAQTIYWFPQTIVLPVLGIAEIMIGFFLILGIAMRLTLVLFWLHLTGTFLVLIMHPDISFQNGNPLLLTIIGEFVIKNIVLVAAGIVVGSELKLRSAHCKDG